MSNDNGTEFNTPVGRIVWGHPLKAQDKTDDNNQKILKDGQPVKRWAWGVAIPKAEFQTQVWPALAAEAAKGYPQGVPPTFSYKYKDGDDPNPTWNNGKQGKPLAERPGHRGCFILSVSTELAPPSVVRFENGVYREVQPDQIKTGDYVAMTIIAKWHAGQSPGLYINPGVVVQAFEGDAIDTGGFDVDPTKAFGNAPQFAMPAGARPIGSTPPAGAGQPGMPGVPPAGMPMGNAPLQPATMPGAPSALPGAVASPPPVQPAPPPPPSAGPQRPADPAHIHMPGTPQEQWYINGAWTPAPAQLPPPATDFIPGAPPPPAAGQMPGMPAPR